MIYASYQHIVLTYCKAYLIQALSKIIELWFNKRLSSYF